MTDSKTILLEIDSITKQRALKCFFVITSAFGSVSLRPDSDYLVMCNSALPQSFAQIVHRARVCSCGYNSDMHTINFRLKQGYSLFTIPKNG